MQHLGCEVFFNFLVDEKAGKLRLNACAGISEDEARRFEWLDFGAAVCGCAAQEGSLIIAEDILHTTDIRTDLFKSCGIQAYACHPLMSREKVIGTLSFGTKARPRFSPDEISLIKTVADQVATAMERKRLIEELRESRGELEIRVRRRTLELVSTNETLRYERELLQTIVDNIPVMLCFYDKNGNVQLASKELEKLLGWSLEDMKSPGFDIMAECYPDPEYRKMVWDHMMEASPGWRDLIVNTRSGATLESSWANVRLSDGSQIGIGLDITERKRAEQAIRESEERFRLITETIRDVFWMSTPGVGRMIYVSPACEAIWGRTRESLYSDPRSFIEAIHPEDKANVLSGLSDHAGGTWEVQYRIVQADGEVRWVHDRGFPIRDENGDLVFMTGIATDVTDLKIAEEKINISMRKLQESNEALQDFASIASHDMQEPLRKVQTFGSILKQRYGSSLGERGKVYLDRMIFASDRMEALLKSLLDYSRLTTNGSPFTEVNLEDIVRGVLSDLEIRIHKAKGKVKLEKLPTIQADSHQMGQLFQNLIGNALKFHKKGERPVVKVLNSSRSAAVCSIAVEDNGIGFDEKYLDRIFKPFQRLTNRSLYEGTGMGLAICKKIVERHGGTITARSTSGEGSTFIITLPVKQGKSFS